MRHTAKVFLWLVLVVGGCTALRPPQTPAIPVTDTYHGTGVVDPYQWIENWNDPRVQAWSQQQNAYTRKILDTLPHVSQLRERITDILTARTVTYHSLSWRAGTLFAMKQQPPLQQPLLVAMRSPDEPGSERVIVNPNTIDTQGATSMDWYVASPDGRFVAVSLSGGGSESGDLHVYDATTGKEIGEPIPRVNGGTAGGCAAWASDASGLYYTRYPSPGERPAEDLAFYQQIWFHKIGTSAGEDRYEIGRDFPRIAEIMLEADPHSGRVLATVQYGDSGRFSHHVREADGLWRQVTDYDDQVAQATFGGGDSLLLISRQGASRGKVLRLSASDPLLKSAEVIVPEGRDTLVSDFAGDRPMVATETLLYVTTQLGGPSEVRVFDLQGHPQAGPKVLPVSTVGQIVALSGDDVLYSNASYITPPAWYRFSPGKATTAKTGLAVVPPVDFSDCEVVREVATSKDGTAVPVNIIRRKATLLDGSHPVLLTGYGGYGINITPSFSSLRRVWLDQGGIFAEANLRGGAEYGQQWHQQGMLTSKQNVFDDFAAAMHHMIDAGYTRPRRLAIMGGSNGGLLMGAMITQHPDLCRAVVSFVGIYDMLRVELAPNGQFNVPEFGTVKDPDQFRALYAYSPYHHVKPGAAYPAVLFLTGANDPRVDPMHSRKMTARLQAATASARPILLRTSATTGHGIGTPLSGQIEQDVDYYAFLLHELGMEYPPPAGAEVRSKR
jgi:prolyl oligopeptidase